MPGDRRRLLLAAPVALLLLAAAAVAVHRDLDRLRKARALSAGLEERIAVLGRSPPPEDELLARRDALSASLAAARARFYDPGETSPYAFGNRIRERLAALGLEVSRYQLVRSEAGAAFEFAASGSALSLATFLQDLFASGRNVAVPSLTVSAREGTGRADAVFEIGYETLDDDDP